MTFSLSCRRNNSIDREISPLSAVTVVSEQVGGAGGDTADQARSTESLDAGNDGSGAAETFESDQVQSKTGDVGSGHRGAGDGVDGGGGANPGRGDAGARSTFSYDISKLITGREGR